MNASLDSMIENKVLYGSDREPSLYAATYIVKFGWKGCQRILSLGF